MKVILLGTARIECDVNKMQQRVYRCIRYQGYLRKV